MYCACALVVLTYQNTCLDFARFPSYHGQLFAGPIGMLGGYGFQGQVTAGEGSDKQGKMGAGYNNLRRKKKKQQCKVGREEEGSSSNQPELALSLRSCAAENR